MSRFPGLLCAAALALSSLPAAHAQTLTAASFDSAPTWMQEVYAERAYAPVWSDRRGAPSRAFENLVRAIQDAETRGLDTSMYGGERLDRLRRESPSVREQGATALFATFAIDLIEGRTDPEIEYQPNFRERREVKKGDLVRDAFRREAPLRYLDRVVPDNFLVERLTGALRTYRAYVEAEAWGPLPSEDAVIKAGERHPLVPALRDRLAAEGFQAGFEIGDEMDESLVAGLKAFQRSRSIKDDGVVGPNTLAALNETPRELADRLAVNIERARWLPERLGERAIFVNAADYTLRLYEGEARAVRIPVIVGETQTQTPIFADTMEEVVVNPYWNVPASILIGEIAPKQIADPGYIARNDFEVLRGNRVVPPSSVDWQQAARGEPAFRVRQTAGDHNALGRIKFLFPNKYAVYLHDTPADALFERDVRTFSHGCIRVKDPVGLGAWILGQPRARVQAMIDSGERIALPTDPIPVYITYFTAFAEPDGTVTFARDVYERDARVAQNLAGS